MMFQNVDRNQKLQQKNNLINKNFENVQSILQQWKSLLRNIT